MITMDKQYTTRDGREVRIYAVDHYGDHPISGAILHETIGWAGATWTESGQCAAVGQSSFDLIEKPKTVKVSFWVNVWPDMIGNLVHPTKYAADSHAGRTQLRIACIHIEREVTEGEGL